MGIHFYSIGYIVIATAAQCVRVGDMEEGLRLSRLHLDLSNEDNQ